MTAAEKVTLTMDLMLKGDNGLDIKQFNKDT